MLYWCTDNGITSLDTFLICFKEVPVKSVITLILWPQGCWTYQANPKPPVDSHNEHIGSVVAVDKGKSALPKPFLCSVI